MRGLAAPVGAQLRRRREGAGLTQQELADRAGVSVGMVRDLEQQRTSRPRARSAEALLEALGAPLERPPGPQPNPPAEQPDRWGVSLQILGPLVIRSGGGELPLGSAMQRALLARLALSVNGTVTTADLVELLWAGEQPRRPSGAVQTHIWRLRSLLEPLVLGPDRPDPAGRYRRGVLRLCPGGYRLNLDEELLDVTPFRRGVQTATAMTRCCPVAAMDRFEQALGHWRGRPVADVPVLAGHPATTALLDEQLLAVMRYADLAAESGQSVRSLPWLRRVAAEHPLHEPVQARLMVALAGSGRQAEALDVYQRVRRRLAEDLGISPGAELTQAQRRVLRQDLVATTGAGRSGGGGRTGCHHGRSGLRA